MSITVVPDLNIGLKREEPVSRGSLRTIQDLSIPKEQIAQPPTQRIEEDTGLIDRLSGRFEQVKRFSTPEEVQRDPITSAIRVGGGFAGGILDIGSAAFEGAMKLVTTERDREITMNALQSFYSWQDKKDPTWKYRGSIPGIIESFEKFEEKNPVLGQTVRDLTNIGLLAPVGELRAPIKDLGARKISTKGVIDVEIKTSAKTSKAIDEAITKGIKPKMRPTAAKQEQFMGQAREAFRVIEEFRPKLADEAGELSVRLPKNRNEMLDSIGQSKGLVFKEYDRLAKQAGQAGVIISTKKVQSELARIANDISYNPDIRTYADSLSRVDIAELERASPQVIQNRIKDLNSSLGSFYDGRISKAKAQVDASVANLLREELDIQINSLTGANYQKLKNQYGALSAIERDVARQVAVEARKANKGLIDFTDIFTGADIIVGAATSNPSSLVRGLAGRAIKEYLKFLNNPNRAIEKAFKLLEQETKRRTKNAVDLRQPIRPNKLFLPPASSDIRSSVGSGKPIDVPEGGFNVIEPRAKKIGGKGQVKKSLPKSAKKQKAVEEIKQKLNKPRKTGPGAMSQDELALAQTLRELKGLSADDIMAKFPDIQLKRDVPVKDVFGNKDVIEAGEVLTPYELKGGKILLQDGETYIVSKNQFANVKGNALSSEAKPFAPELEGLEESVKQVNKVGTTEKGQPIYAGGDTKYENYQLPGGENYKEILIKAPQNIDVPLPSYAKAVQIKSGDSAGKWQIEVEGIGKASKLSSSKKEAILDYNKGTLDETASAFKSSHWDEPNIIAHLRMNERTFKGKKVSFMEELQSDWAREGRSKGFAGDVTGLDARRLELENKGKNATPAEKREWADIQNKLQASRVGVPFHPLVKGNKWQEPTVKRALQDAVDSNADYFAWINGEQTSARYNLATEVENVKWGKVRQGGFEKHKDINLSPKESGKEINVRIDENGVITSAQQADWKGKSLDEVLGKGLADAIMEKEAGSLSGEGLSFGGEWANNLYDKQVKNIVEKVTGGKVVKMDMGLPIGDKSTNNWFAKLDTSNGNYLATDKLTKKNLKVGKEIFDNNASSYIITDILEDGKFKAVSKMMWEKAKENPLKTKKLGKGTVQTGIDMEVHKKTFDISINTTTQQGIKLTPAIKAKIKGEAIKLKKTRLKTKKKTGK